MNRTLGRPSPTRKPDHNAQWQAFAAPFRARRIEMGLTQIEAAKYAGIGENTMSEFEVGARNVGIDVVVRLLTVYGCKLELSLDME